MTRGRKQLRRWLLVSLCVSAVVGISDRPAVGQSKEVDALVASRMAKTRAPGMAVAVTVGSKRIHVKGYGIANLETQTRVSQKTAFNLQSVTKTFTALAAMKLVETGELSLEDPLSIHLENIPAAWKAITIRQLLSNTSGIKSFTTLQADEQRCNAGQDVSTYKRGDAIREVECFPLEFAPGEKWKYGDTGFYLVGMVIEKISGQDYGSFIKEHLLTPLGMTNTAVLDYSTIVPNRADGYGFRDQKLVNATRFDLDEFANGGLISTLEDMILFEQAFLTEKVLVKKSIDTMLSNARLNSGETVVNYGLGVGLTPYKSHKRFGHTGGGGLGFSTAFVHFPDSRTTVIVLVNSDQEKIGDFANSIAELFFGQSNKRKNRQRGR